MDTYIAICHNGCINDGVQVKIQVEINEPKPLVNCGPCGGKPITDIKKDSV